jgi:hypothetical protein
LVAVSFVVGNPPPENERGNTIADAVCSCINGGAITNPATVSTVMVEAMKTAVICFSIEIRIYVLSLKGYLPTVRDLF